MRIYYANDGTVPPQIQSDTGLFFDHHTNPELYATVRANPSAYRVTNGVLTKDGEPVAINPPCEDCQTLDSLDSATTIAQLRKVLLLMRDRPGFTRG